MAKKNKGLNVNKVNEVMNEVPNIDELLTKKEKVNMNKIVSLDNVKDMELISTVEMMSDEDALKRMQEDMELVTLKEELKEEIKVDEEPKVKEEKKMDKVVKSDLVTKLDIGIRNAILAGKNAPSKSVVGKRLLAIQKSYKQLTGVDMTTQQINYLKTCNDTQILNVEYTLNYVRRDIRNNEFVQRQQQVATAQA